MVQRQQWRSWPPIQYRLHFFVATARPCHKQIWTTMPTNEAYTRYNQQQQTFGSRTGDSRHKNVCIPKKTQQDTEYCVRLWEEWCQHRQSNLWDSIPQLTELQPTELLTSFWSCTKRWFWVFPRHSKPHFLWPNAPSAMENSTCYQPL